MTKSATTYYPNYIPATVKSILMCLLLSSAGMVSAQDVSRPPELGQETKGTPAIIEPTAEATEQEVTVDEVNNETVGQVQITERRRESGQLYQIELTHASGVKQYIVETDSDGKIESTDNDIEETPNLPKWKIGSW